MNDWKLKESYLSIRRSSVATWTKTQNGDITWIIRSQRDTFAFTRSRGIGLLQWGPPSSDVRTRATADRNSFKSIPSPDAVRTTYSHGRHPWNERKGQVFPSFPSNKVPGSWLVSIANCQSWRLEFGSHLRQSYFRRKRTIKLNSRCPFPPTPYLFFRRDVDAYSSTSLLNSKLYYIWKCW